MANQIMAVVETQLPAEPDLAALSQMQAPIVMVHKITRGEKNRENTQLVINGLTGLSMSDILKLQDQLPTGQLPNSGPGVYRFSVTDGDSAAKASWQTRLGGAVENNAAATPGLPALQTMAHGTALPFGSVPTAAAVQPIQVPLSATARPIGNGFYYDEALGLLTAPDGSIHAWRKGQPLPGLMTTSAAGSTPVSALPGPGVPFFAPSPELEMTKQALTATQRALEEAQRQREQERTETARQKEITELRDSIKAIASQLSARPAESAEVADLKRRLESQDMIAAMQASTKAQIDAIRDLVREQGNSNRGLDPIITVLTSMMQQGHQASAETLRMVRETAGAERQTLMTVLDRQAAMAEKAAANNPLEKVGSILDVLVERFGRVMQIEREFSGGGGGTDWVGIIKEAVGKAGSAVEMYQQAKAQEARATEATARAQIATAQASVSRDRTLVAIKGGKPAVPAAPAGAPAPAPASVPQAPVAAPSTKVRITLPDLEKATVGELREIFGPERDESFFGSFYDHVKQLRTALVAAPAQFSARKIAELLMQAREHLAAEAQSGRGVPHAAEIWAHGQVAYLLERLLPEAAEGLRSEVVKALTMLEAEVEDAERIAANTSDDGDGEGDAS